VDSILVDEARTPLIISGPAEESTEKYYIVDKIVPKLKGRIILERDEIDAKFKGEDLSIGYDFMIDEKAHTASLTEQGEAKVCSALNIANLHDLETMEWRHHVLQALRAHNLYRKDVEYVVKEGQVLIVDEFTGRLMPGRRWSDGLHQAVEAKEGLKIERENQTLATVTFQNYFRMYEKLSGMTGTAFTEANEFKAIYQLDVVVIPTNRPLVRKNYSDRIYKTEKEKFNAVVEEIVELYKEGTPVLVGTISIEKSELLSEMLKRRGIQHQVLNAKYHETEAQIIAQAGRFKAVTIATNMAGRGTDIILGGNPEFVARSIARQKIKADDPNFAQEYKTILDKYKKESQEEHDKVVGCGGLHVLGTERHDARRIDNQLRGRCGRQGDPGSSRFSVSLEDNLMRLFGSNKLIGIMNKLGLEEGQVIEHPWVTHSIEIAQKRVEQHNFEIRKQLLEYDNVMNKQREVIYARRKEILEGVALKEEIIEFAKDAVADIVSGYYGDTSKGAELDKAALINAFKLTFGVEINPDLINDVNKEVTIEDVSEMAIKAYDIKEEVVGKDLMRFLEHAAFLQIIDTKWKEHLYAMDNLREGIGLRAYGQRDPLIEYKREGFQMFSDMMYSIEREVVETVYKMQPAKPERVKGVFSEVSKNLVHNEVEQFGNAPVVQEEEGGSVDLDIKADQGPVAQAHAGLKVGRNDPCPCGSGKKYKKCCGK
ncbi:MAG: preprotein translocase subunit SecA, partial [Candidatus Omnitrophota bacterium]